ncbi:hypothetical protein ACQ4PT_059192 [Festuca glaucescens]
MDPAEMVNLHFHFGGEFFPGPRLEYIGGDEAISVVERDRLSLAEIKGYLNDHTVVKDSMKYYFPLPGKELKNGLIFLYEGSGCTKISDHINVGGVAEVYVEHHVEEEEHVSEDSDSDFEDEIGSMEGDSDAEHPHSVLTAGEDDEVDAPNSETLFAKGNSRKGHDVLWNGKDGFEVKHQARTDAHVNASQQDQRQGKRKGAKEQNIQAKKKKANE